MSDFLDEFTPSEEEAKSAIDEVMRYVNELVAIQEQISTLQEQLDALNKRADILSTKDIPNYMLSHGLEALSLANGKKVSVKEDLTVRIPTNDDGKNKVLSWLISHGGSELIKDEMIIRDPEEWIKESLKSKEVVFDLSKTVNTNSLKAWFKRGLGMTNGSMQTIDPASVPQEANLYIYRKTDIH